MFCVELDIPLAKMTRFIEEDGTLDFRGFISEGRDVAQKKLAAIKKGMKNLSQIEHQINLAEQYRLGEIYTREIPERKFHVTPCGNSIKGTDPIEIMKSYSNLPYWNDESWVDEIDDISEFGVLREHNGAESMYSYFAKVPSTAAGEHIRTISGGTYLCTQTKNNDRKIEKAADVFSELVGKPFIAIETEIITGRHKANEPLWELRVLSLQ
jgi:hypothetical protein